MKNRTLLTLLAITLASPVHSEPDVRFGKDTDWTLRFSWGTGWTSGNVLTTDSAGRYKIEPYKKNAWKGCFGQLNARHVERVASDVALILETEWVLPTKDPNIRSGDGLTYSFSVWRHKKVPGMSDEYHYDAGGSNYLNLGRGWSKLGHYLREASDEYAKQCQESRK